MRSPVSTSSKIGTCPMRICMLPCAVKTGHHLVPARFLLHLRRFVGALNAFGPRLRLPCVVSIAASYPSLCSVFRVRFLCFQSLTASFCTPPGCHPLFPQASSKSARGWRGLALATQVLRLVLSLFPATCELFVTAFWRSINLFNGLRTLLQNSGGCHTPADSFQSRASSLKPWYMIGF